MKKLMYQKRYLILGLLGIIILTGVLVWTFSSKNATSNTFSKKEKTWQTVEVKIAKDFSSIKVPAKVKSNQFAIISPRRNGIIQDLLVDIGDEVYKGQTIGSMLPEGVEGQGSAAINEASARLQKARSALSNAKGVSIDAVSVATKQWEESNLQSNTQSNLKEESQRQLTEKKSEAILVATQVWENTKQVLFGIGNNNYESSIDGSFASSIQENKVINLSKDIQRMENSGEWNDEKKVIEHLSHLENLLFQFESLYKSSYENASFSKATISGNLKIIQTQQLRISGIKQNILALEEKNQRFSSVQTEREAGSDRSKEVLSLVQSQQNLSTTQAEKNVAVALAGYNAALVKSGHQSIKSPFSGVITARMIEVGQSVMINMPLFYLEGAQTARSQESLSEIHFSLPESWRSKVKVGDKIMLKTMEGKSSEGKIFRLSDQINLGTNSIMATATAFEKTYETIVLENEVENENIEETKENERTEIITPINFNHGQSIFVYVEESDSSIFTVPTLSLKKRSNNYFLWKMEEKKPVQLQVQVMAEDGEFSQIFSDDLKVDDFIISNPSVSLFKKSK